MKPLTDLQYRCICALGFKCLSGLEIAQKVKPEGKSGRQYLLAVTKAMRGLEKRGKAGCFRSHPGDRWSSLVWFIRKNPSEPFHD